MFSKFSNGSTFPPRGWMWIGVAGFPLTLLLTAIVVASAPTPQSQPRPQSQPPAAAAAPATQAVGTIQGTFAVDANGAASYSMDIDVPPGTLGVAPKLSVIYASQAGDGLLGNGFVLQGLSSITRCDASLRLDGYNGGIQFNAKDRFCLDGQRLVKISGGGDYGDDGSVYHTEHETWTRVTAVGRCGSGPCSFTVQNKDGWTLLFGAGDSAVKLPNAQEIANWQIASTTDLHGNRVTVSYQFNPNTLQNLPQEIAYTANASAGLTPTRRVTFAYEPRGLAIPRYVGGYRFLLDRRLKTIHTSVDNTEVFQYRLAYTTSEGTGRDRLTAIQQCAAPGEPCFPATQLQWQEETNALQSPNSRPDGLVKDRWCAEANAIVGWADFNGDGRPDAHCDTPSGVHRVLLSTGDGLQSPNSNPQGEVKTAWCAGTGFAPGWVDFNGDGKVDLVCDGTDGTHRVLLSDGSTVAPPPGVPADGLVKANWCAGTHAHAHWANFNADGRADLVCSTSDGTQSALVSTGNGVTSPNTSDPSGILKKNWCADAGSITFWGDFNGDQLADVHCSTTSGLQQVLLSTGEALASPNSDPAGTVATGWCAGPDRQRGSTDLNGDGLLDSYCSSTDGRHWVLLSTGTTLESPNTSGDGLLRSSWCGGASASSSWADFNGDGLADLLCSDGSGRVLALLSTGTGLRSPNSSGDGELRANWCAGGTGRSAWADFNGDGLDDVTCDQAGTHFVLIHTPGAPDLAHTITDGIGHLVTLTYAPITDAAVYDEGDPATYPMLDVRSPMQVVSQYVNSDGQQGQYSFHTRYRGARTDLQAQRWLGFQQVTTTEDVNGRKTIVSYQQDYPITAFVTSTVITNANGTMLTRGTYEPVVTTPYPNVSQVLVAKETNSTFTNGVADYVVTKTSQYDAFGNRTYEADDSTPYYSVFTCQRYVNDSAAWRLGYPTAQKTTRTSASCLAFLTAPSPSWNPTTDLRWTDLDYDAQMNQKEQRAWDDVNAVWVTLGQTFDAAGNVITRTDAAGHVTTYTFDDSLTFPKTETSPALADGRHLTLHYTFHRAFGSIASRVDPSGTERLTPVDAFGRPSEVRGPDPAGASGTATVTLHAYAYGQDAVGRYIETRDRPSWTDANPANWFYTRQYYDGMGRTFRQVQRSTRPGVDIVSEMLFDQVGLEWKQAVPHYSDASADFVVTTYDLLNRPLTVTTPDGTIERHEYLKGAIDVRTTEAFGTPDARTTRLTSDPRGLALRTEAPNGGVTTVQYDAVSQPTMTVGPTGSSTTSTYDSIGRVVKSVDSDRGTSQSTYDTAGRLRVTTNGAGKSTHYDYDALLRLTTRAIDPAGGGPPVTYTFEYDNPTLANAQGNLTAVIGPGFRKDLSYSRYTLIATEKLTLDGQVYLDSTEYDPQGHQRLRTFADGSVLRTTRYVNGLPHSFDLQSEGAGPFVNYGTYTSYTALQQPIRFVGGNGIQTDYTYDAVSTGLARPHTTMLSRPQQPGFGPWGVSYEWNRFSEITRTDRTHASDPVQIDRYTRDNMGWLITASGPSGNETYAYNLAGNITRKDGVTYRYQPNTNKLQDASNGTTFTYDGAGHLHQRHITATTWHYDHDGGGRLANVTRNGQANDTALYDSDNLRLRRVDGTGVVSRYIAPDLDSVESQGSVRLTKYVEGLSSPIAAITTPRSAPQMRGLLLRERAAREAGLYNPHTIAGLVPWTTATLRRLAVAADEYLFTVLDITLLIIAIAGPAFVITRARARRREMTPFGQRHPFFRAIVPCLIASLLLLDAAPVQGQLGPGEGYPTPGTLYFHSDLVDSTVLVTDQDGHESTRVRYDPFGTVDQTRSHGPNNFRPKFSAKERDARSGLDYFGARYYDPATGRFLEPDPQSQYSSPYEYAGNSPIDHVDPNGELAFVAVVIIAAVVGAAAGAYAGGAAVNHTYNPFVWDWSSGRTMAGIFAGAGIGAAGGALGAVAGSAGVAAGIVAETVIGAAENVAFTAMGGGSQKEIFESALTGAAFGFVTAGLSAGISSSLSEAASSGSRLAQRAERQLINSEVEMVDLSPPAPCSSFPAGTLVAGAGGELEPIEDAKPGSLVLGKLDDDTPAGSFPVLAQLSREAASFIDVTIDHTVVRATTEHAFWVDGNGWTPARALAPRDRVMSAGDRLLPIAAVTPVETRAPVFNVEVADAHDYYVSPLRLLVHNQGKCTRSTRRAMLRKGHDILGIRGGKRSRFRPVRFGWTIRRHGPAGTAPGTGGGMYVDFGPVVERSVTITLQGSYYLDFAAADMAAGITKGYRARMQLTWHHVEGITQVPGGGYEGRMQLISTTRHQGWPHYGGVEEYRTATGGGYGQ